MNIEYKKKGKKIIHCFSVLSDNIKHVLVVSPLEASLVLLMVIDAAKAKLF